MFRHATMIRFFAACISLCIIVLIMAVHKYVDYRANEMQIGDSQRRMQYHDSRSLRIASLLHDPSHMCAKSRVFIMVYIHSAPDNFIRRMRVRDTWANRVYLETLRTRVVFVMGITNNERTMDAIKEESELYKDILQGDFVDAYKNLSIKALFSLTWLSENCLNTSYVLKTDDDIVANIETLTVQLRMRQRHTFALNEGLLLCRVWNKLEVIREVNSKWYVSKIEFEADVYPRFCTGWAFIMSPDVVDRLIEASKHTDFLWVDDAYLTGLVAAKAGVNHTNFSQAYQIGDQLNMATKDKTNSKIFYHCTDAMVFYGVWEKMQFRKQQIKDHSMKEIKNIAY